MRHNLYEVVHNVIETALLLAKHAAHIVKTGHHSVSLHHRSVLNILDSLLANQIPAKGVVTIVCRTEIRKMAEC